MSKKPKSMDSEELGNKLLRSVREMKAGKVARATQIAANEVAAARMKSGLSQTEFAQALQISPRTLQEWEQGRGVPRGVAKYFLILLQRDPDRVRKTLAPSPTRP